jgi:hypothetical protein
VSVTRSVNDFADLSFLCSTIGPEGFVAGSGIAQFFNQHSSAFFALLGALGGAFLSFLASWVLRKREYDLQLWMKLIDRRIRAHEDLIKVALEMRVMIALGGVDDKGEVLRVPRVLLSREAFES